MVLLVFTKLTVKQHGIGFLLFKDATHGAAFGDDSIMTVRGAW